MSSNILNIFLQKFIRFTPILICIFFILLDSVPFYLFPETTFKTQIGLVFIYSWICINHERIRPLLILFIGLLIDLFCSFIFGTSSLVLLVIFFIQRKNTEILLSRFFKNTWIYFVFFLIGYNLISNSINILYSPYMSLNILEILFSMLLSILFFPFIFSLVNNLNEKIKAQNE